MRWYSTICLALIIVKLSTPAFSQSGFYLVIPCNQSAPTQQKVLLYEYEPVCVVNQPVLGLESVSSVSALHELPSLNAAYFEIQLSEKGYHTLKELSSKILDADFAFVVDDQVLFVTNYSTTEVFRVIRIYRTSTPEALKPLHTRLKLMIDEQKK